MIAGSSALILLGSVACEKTPEAIRKDFPFVLEWPDRRPIGQLLLARGSSGWSGNPRGWFNNETLDLSGQNGQIDFERDLRQYTDQSITWLTRLKAQGVIVWDLEGEEFPQPSATYAGDPRQLGRLAPEMDAAADGFFKQFKRNGFRIGVCIRPQHVVFDGVRRFHQEEYWFDPQAIHRELTEKINYAQRRWDCTLFYIDSNFGPLNFGLYDVTIFQRLRQEHPDCLLIPEFENASYFSCTTPYYGLRGYEKWPGTRMLSAQAAPVYPGAVSVINCAGVDFPAREDLLSNSLRRGDIFLFRCWWPSPEVLGIEAIYRRTSEGGS